MTTFMMKINHLFVWSSTVVTFKSVKWVNSEQKINFLFRCSSMQKQQKYKYGISLNLSGGQLVCAQNVKNAKITVWSLNNRYVHFFLKFFLLLIHWSFSQYMYVHKYLKTKNEPEWKRNKKRVIEVKLTLKRYLTFYVRFGVSVRFILVLFSPW